MYVTLKLTKFIICQKYDYILTTYAGKITSGHSYPLFKVNEMTKTITI